LLKYLTCGGDVENRTLVDDPDRVSVEDESDANDEDRYREGALIVEPPFDRDARLFRRRLLLLLLLLLPVVREFVTATTPNPFADAASRRSPAAPAATFKGSRSQASSSMSTRRFFCKRMAATMF
jgi:hypothetical protein